MTCMKRIFSQSSRIKVGQLVGVALTSGRCFHAELVRTELRIGKIGLQLVANTEAEYYIYLSSLSLLTSGNLLFPQVKAESSGLPIVHHSKYVCELPANHRFPMAKFPRVLHFLLQDQIITEKQVRNSCWLTTVKVYSKVICYSIFGTHKTVYMLLFLFKNSNNLVQNVFSLTEGL